MWCGGQTRRRGNWQTLNTPERKKINRTLRRRKINKNGRNGRKWQNIYYLQWKIKKKKTKTGRKGTFEANHKKKERAKEEPETETTEKSQVSQGEFIER